MLALAYAYQLDGDCAQAIDMLTRTGQPEVFDLIAVSVKDPAMQRSVCSALIPLFRIDKERAAEVVGDVKHFKIDEIIPILDADRSLQFAYLRHVFDKYPTRCENYHGLLMTLYGEFDPQSLLFFFQRTTCYSQSDGMALCRTKGCHDAEAFLLKRMGKPHEALDILTSRLHDVPSAVSLVSEYRETELWAQLVDYVLKNPGKLADFWTALDDPDLEVPHCASHSALLRQIPTRVSMPNLGERTSKVLHDLMLESSLLQSCAHVLQIEHDCMTREVFSRRERGIVVEPSSFAAVREAGAVQVVVDDRKKPPSNALERLDSEATHEIPNLPGDFSPYHAA
jgi:hypothetical protein